MAADSPAAMPAATPRERARSKRMAVEITTVMATGRSGLSTRRSAAAAATTKAPDSTERIQAVHRLVTPSRASLVVFRKASQA